MKKYYKAEAYAKKYARQAGMTLIELTVVLLILIGLAGLMIPYVTGFISKTHDSTGSANTREIGNAIVRYETQFGSYPGNLDSLIIGTGAAAGTLIDYSIADVMGVVNGMPAMNTANNYQMSALDFTTVADFAVPDADGEICGSLLKAGLGTLRDMDSSATVGFNATFANSTNSVTLGATMGPTAYQCVGTVAEIAAAEVSDALGIDTTNKRYVVFGLGQNADLIGKTIQEAPVHFAKNANMNASQAYNRFGVVFEVDQDTTTNLASADAMRAKYTGTIMLMGDTAGLQSELASYYTTATEEAN